MRPAPAGAATIRAAAGEGWNRSSCGSFCLLVHVCVESHGRQRGAPLISTRAHNLAIATMLLASVFAALVPMKGLIICFGADGHLFVSQAPAEEVCPCAVAEACGTRKQEHDGVPCRDIRIRPTETLAREAGSSLSVSRPHGDDSMAGERARFRALISIRHPGARNLSALVDGAPRRAGAEPSIILLI